jgi:imidazolonepropionase-like amidohydrolase
VRAQKYQRHQTTKATLPRGLGTEALGRVLRHEIPARARANNATDIRAGPRLPQEFNLGVAGYGMTDDQVLRAVTLVPARILGVADRVGSLDVGKDADVIVLDGHPLRVKTWVRRVCVNGELVYTK